MKRILGLDLGTNSIGWALVEEAENKKEVSSIIKLGVRVNPLTTDEKTNFEKGRPISTNAYRSLKRGARKNLQRYKQRRENLIKILKEHNIIDDDTPLTEVGKGTTHQTLQIRATAASNRIELKDFAKVLLTINKKRGYKSSRKAVNEKDGLAIDGMAVAKTLYDHNLTPGQYVLELLNANRTYIPDFYRSDLKEEFKKIWNTQQEYYSELTNELFAKVDGKNKSQTYAILQEPLGLEGIKIKGSKAEQRILKYQFRVDGLNEKLAPEHLAIALQEINNEINQSSGYLGAIADRSKILYLKKQTVGQNLYSQLVNDPHTSLKNQVFYRQDYLDEFETIWTTQAKFHKELTYELKEIIRDVVIFYQRKLKSQKSLISLCQFESWEQEYVIRESEKTKTRTVGRRVIPKSSLLFQQFKIWQNLNRLIYVNKEKEERIELKKADEKVRQTVFEELNLRGDLSSNEVLKILKDFYSIRKLSDWKCNFEKVEGNRTNHKLYNVFQEIAEFEGYGMDWSRKSALQITEELKNIFPEIGIKAAILDFDPLAVNFSTQKSYELWHLLYSAEDDEKISEEDKLVYGNNSVAIRKKLHQKYGFKPEYAKLLSNIRFKNDYGNLSAKAIRNILPYLQEGNEYSEACRLAGYNHSNSLDKDELSKRELLPKLELLKKNSLRNPVVEKILNQMVNLVNQVIETYGKPDEIRIELARELKKTASERKDMTQAISDATKRNQDIKKTITKEFGIPNPTKSDVERYRLWQELESRGHKSLFDDKYIPKQKLFSKEIDIEHIIPKALIFDDSFSNKTLCYREANLKKANRTAFDFIMQDSHSEVEKYKERVEALYGDGRITRSKRNKLLMPQSEIPNDFIERDLRNSQYITREAKKMLFKVFRTVTVTSGSITDRLRGDWDLINIMKELNLPKYRALGLTEYEERIDIGAAKLIKYEVIRDWSKRNDQRHHAMDALTVAFTTHNHIQYINNLNARRDTSQDNHSIITNIENLITEINEKGKRVFKKPVENFRENAKTHIQQILVSYKAKNKVVTRNVNKTKKKGKDNYNKKVQLTPRGQLHKETVYGKSLRPMDKKTKLNSNFTIEDAKMIVNKKKRHAVLNHLAKYENNCKKAFASKTLKQSPITYRGEVLIEVTLFEKLFTVRK